MKYLKLYNSKQEKANTMETTPFVATTKDQPEPIIGSQNVAQKVHLVVQNDQLQIEKLPNSGQILRVIAAWKDSGLSVDAFRQEVQSALFDDYSYATSKYDFARDGFLSPTIMSIFMEAQQYLPYTGSFSVPELKVMAYKADGYTLSQISSEISDAVFGRRPEEYWMDINCDGYTDVTDISQASQNYWYLYPAED